MTLWKNAASSFPPVPRPLRAPVHSSPSSTAVPSTSSAPVVTSVRRLYTIRRLRRGLARCVRTFSCTRKPRPPSTISSAITPLTSGSCTYGVIPPGSTTNPALLYALTAWNTDWYRPSPSPNCGTKRSASSSVPTPCAAKVYRTMIRSSPSTPPTSSAFTCCASC